MRRLRLASLFALSVLSVAPSGCGVKTLVGPPQSNTTANFHRIGANYKRFAYITLLPPSGETTFVSAYMLPLTSGERPSARIVANGPGSTAVGPGALYVADRPDHVSEYALPLRTGEERENSVTQAEATALALGGGYLFATAHPYNHLSASDFAVPFYKGEERTATIDGLHDPRGLAVDANYLYVVNQCTDVCRKPGLVQAYKLPLLSEESPSVSLTGLYHPLGIAVDARNLYVASYLERTIDAYRLPLVNNEKPFLKITPPEAPDGLAIDSHALYAATYSKSILVYPLPIGNGNVIQVTLPDASLTYSLAVDP